MAQKIHVFSGAFGSKAVARGYSEQQWALPKPDASWSEAEVAAWEENNPTWCLRQDLQVDYMDSDFVETIFGPDKVEYLETQLKHAADRDRLKSEIPEAADTLVLIMSAAFDGKRACLSSTPRLRYHGEFHWNLG